MNAKAAVKIIIIAALLLCAGLNGDVFAQAIPTTPVTLTKNSGVTISKPNVVIGAQVPFTLTLTYWIQKVPGTSNNPYGPGSFPATSLDFGTLEKPVAPNYVCYADSYFVVFLMGDAAGNPYTVAQSCPGITDSAGNNLNYSLIMTPGFEPEDRGDPTWQPQGPMPDKDHFGDPAFAVGTNNLIFYSAGDNSHIWRCYYGIATGASPDLLHPNTYFDPPALKSGIKLIDPNTAAGTYHGIITFTITCN